jgi:hypothetical protein
VAWALETKLMGPVWLTTAPILMGAPAAMTVLSAETGPTEPVEPPVPPVTVWPAVPCVPAWEVATGAALALAVGLPAYGVGAVARTARPSLPSAWTRKPPRTAATTSWNAKSAASRRSRALSMT